MPNKHTAIAGIAYYILVFLAAGYRSSNIVAVALAPIVYLILACLSAFASYVVVTIAGFVATIGYFLFGLEKPVESINHMDREAIIYIVFMAVLIGMPIYRFM